MALNNFQTVIATDGSVADFSAGCGIFSSCKFAFSTRLPNFSSVYYSEFYALVLALLFIKKYKTDKTLCITDSLSLLTALNSSTFTMELQFLRELINQIAATRQICLCWTPGHVGINPNEAADLLAKSALSTPSTDLDMLAYFPNILINRYFRFLDYNYFQHALLDTRESYSWLQHKINYSVFPDRFSEVHFRRFRCGRGLTRLYAERFLRFNTNLCNCRIPFSVDDAEHFFFQCEFFTQPRMALLQLFSSLQIPLTLNTLLTLGSSHNPSISLQSRKNIAVTIAAFLHFAHSKGFLQF